MQLKYILTLCVALLATTVIAAPLPEDTVETTLDRRSVAPKFTFTNDLADIVIPPPLPATAAKKAIAAQNKKIAKAKANQAAKEKLQQAAAARVTAVLNAASAPLKLSGALPVKITNDFHTSKSDPESHATFQFSAPACSGQCVGHAYNPVSKISPGKGQPGKIFDAKHATIFGANDI